MARENWCSSRGWADVLSWFFYGRFGKFPSLSRAEMQLMYKYHTPHAIVFATEGGTPNVLTAACDTEENTQDMVDCETITYKFCTQGAGKVMLEQSCSQCGWHQDQLICQGIVGFHCCLIWCRRFRSGCLSAPSRLESPSVLGCAFVLAQASTNSSVEQAKSKSGM